MMDTNWAPGDRIQYLDANGRLAYGTVTSVDSERERVYATLDGYSTAVKGCFHTESRYVSKVTRKKKGSKK
jgi:hypothetical protein